LGNMINFIPSHHIAGVHVVILAIRHVCLWTALSQTHAHASNLLEIDLSI
jgi:hypothetical protein